MSRQKGAPGTCGAAVVTQPTTWHHLQLLQDGVSWVVESSCSHRRSPVQRPGLATDWALRLHQLSALKVACHPRQPQTGTPQCVHPGQGGGVSAGMGPGGSASACLAECQVGTMPSECTCDGERMHCAREQDECAPGNLCSTGCSSFRRELGRWVKKKMWERGRVEQISS